jgi:acetylornithine aminotransferase
MKSTLLENYGRLDVAFTSGEGAWLKDDQGKRYLDALSGISVCNLGHAHPRVREAISDQAGKLIHTSNLYQIPLQEALGAKLCHLTGLDRVFFANSGAEANEAAIKMVRKHASEKGVKVPVIVVMEGSFHGRTIATLSATGNEKVKHGFAPLVEGFHQIPYGDINALESLKDQGEDICAVMMEPVQGEGGIVIPPQGYLKAVSECCKSNDWLLVLDEIQTGMCRTGKWFASQHESVIPDIMTIAKALGNGLPIGACLAREDIARVMQPGTHGSTFGGNPLCARAALAVVDFMDENHIPERANTLGAIMRTALIDKLSERQGVRSIRSLGMMFGIELEKDCGELVARGLDKGILLNVTAGNVVRLLPPLVISDAEALQVVALISELIIEFLEKS